MHSAKLTTARLKRTFTIFSVILFSNQLFAQENSPYSRYGIGDVVPNQNISTRGMGGISAGYSDPQSLNLVNPAALGNTPTTIFDLGGEVDVRNLKSTTTPEKYKATNTLISYLQLGFPVASQKMMRKNIFWGMSFGLRPVTRISYKIETAGRLPGIDSVRNLYEGSGGLTQANVSTGFRIKQFSFGLSSGYAFGNKDYSTKLALINDSIAYYKSNSGSLTRFGGGFLNAGLQYDIITKKKGLLRLGAYTNFQQTLNAKRETIAQTIDYDADGGIQNIDTVSYTTGEKGKLVLPATYGFGFTFTPDSTRRLLIGADLEMTNWKDYRFYGQPDALQNNFTIRAGMQYQPAKANTPASNYWSFVKYRLGGYYGNDYVKLNNVNRLNYGVTVGAGLPLTSLQRLSYYREMVVLNTGIEYNARGNRQSFSIRENVVRFSIGLSMNARWFAKPKYD